MSMDFAALEVGQTVSDRSYLLDSDAVGRYVEAVGDRSWDHEVSDGPSLVPPMAVAALGLGGVVRDMGIPGGTLHAGQELEFSGSVRVGESLRCRATLLQSSLRGEWRFVVIALAITNGGGQPVVGGKSTITLPRSDP